MAAATRAVVPRAAWLGVGLGVALTVLGCGGPPDAPSTTGAPATDRDTAAESDVLDLVGAWRLLSYVKADTQVRYRTEGYMVFSRSHWMHAAYFNRDAREQDFAEAHHGTYRVTGPSTAVLEVDMELHMDPKAEFQDAPVWYGPAATIDATYRREGNRVVMDFASGAQLELERIE